MVHKEPGDKLLRGTKETGGGSWPPCALNAGTGAQSEGTTTEKEYGLCTVEVLTS